MAVASLVVALAAALCLWLGVRHGRVVGGCEQEGEADGRRHLEHLDGDRGEPGGQSHVEKLERAQRGRRPIGAQGRAAHRPRSPRQEVAVARRLGEERARGKDDVDRVAHLAVMGVVLGHRVLGRAPRVGAAQGVGRQEDAPPHQRWPDGACDQEDPGEGQQQERKQSARRLGRVVDLPARVVRPRFLGSLDHRQTIVPSTSSRARSLSSL